MTGPLPRTRTPRVTPPWMEQATCRTHPNPDLWYPNLGDSVSAAQAKTICAQCPARLDCYADALTRGEEHGIWGGHNFGQRKPTKTQPETTCQHCGTTFTPNHPNTRYCSKTCKTQTAREAGNAYYQANSERILARRNERRRTKYQHPHRKLPPVEELIMLKQAGVTNAEIAQRFKVLPKSVDRAIHRHRQQQTGEAA